MIKNDVKLMKGETKLILTLYFFLVMINLKNDRIARVKKSFERADNEAEDCGQRRRIVKFWRTCSSEK